MFNRLTSLFRRTPKGGKGKGGRGDPRFKGGKGAPQGKGGKGGAPGKGAFPPIKVAPLPQGRGGSPQGGPSSAPAVGPPSPPPAPSGVSLDRRLDIIGIALFFVGVLTVVSLFTANQSPVPAAWVHLLGQIAGWGVFGLPVGFIAVGLWLILRKFGDKLPKFEPERLTGLILLYLALLATLHFFTPSVTAPRYAEFFDFAGAGQGGGLVGAVILWALFSALGAPGSAVLLGAWWIIAVVFTAGLSVPELVALIARGMRRGGAHPARPPDKGPRDARQLPLPESKSPGKGGKPEFASPPKPGEPAAPPTGTPGSKVPSAPSSVPSATPSAAVPIILGGAAAPAVVKPWELPRLDDALEPGSESSADDEFDRKRVQIIEGTLASFGAPVRVVEINRGPTITQYGVEPDYVEQRGGKKTKVKVGKIAALADDLALALSAQSIRIEAPVPGKGYVGIEVPNVVSSLVALRDVMESEAFDQLKGTLRLGLGQDVSGNAICADLAQMPHLLIAGTTGSGKSVCVNSIIASLLLQNTPDDCKFLMVDPKRVELTGYNGVPHLLVPVVVDLERVVASLQWVSREMDERYRKFAKAGVRNIGDYNVKVQSTSEKKLPYLIVIIDELADLMMLAPDETERTITRLAQLARATGIHLIIATQRPSVDVVTGLIKANFPARIAFAVASSVDSRVIIDQPGAERLLGRGDMLFQSPDAATPLRMQGVFVADHELHRLVQYWKEARLERMPTSVEAPAPVETPEAASSAASRPAAARQPPLPEMGPLVDIIDFEAEKTPEGEDELLEDAVKAVREMKKASISSLQRRLRIGYTRAARLIDVLEEKGIVGPAKPGAQQREVIGLGDAVLDPTQKERASPAKEPTEKKGWSTE